MSGSAAHSPVKVGLVTVVVASRNRGLSAWQHRKASLCILSAIILWPDRYFTFCMHVYYNENRMHHIRDTFESVGLTRMQPTVRFVLWCCAAGWLKHFTQDFEIEISRNQRAVIVETMQSDNNCWNYAKRTHTKQLPVYQPLTHPGTAQIVSKVLSIE